MDETRVDPHLVRESAIAGTWYPGRREELDALVARYLADAPAVTLGGELVGLVAPHAGYAYSGAVAAHAYRLLDGRHYDVVAVISRATATMRETSWCHAGATIARLWDWWRLPTIW